jgi:hypothetical protein
MQNLINRHPVPVKVAISYFPENNTCYKSARGIMSISKVINKYKLNEQPNDFSFWQTKSYEERLAALEQIRREYNLWRYNAEQGLQRVYKIIKRT